MNPRFHRGWLAFLVVAIGAVSFPGCARVNVRKVAPDGLTPGQRYSLPQPFLVITPQSDGTLEVRTELLPDESEQYAVESESFFANADLTVKTEREMLVEVSWSGDADDVASATAKAAGDTAKAAIESQAKADAAAAAEQKAIEGKLEDAKLALKQAKADEAAAQAKVDHLKSQPGTTAQELTTAESDLAAKKLATQKAQNVEDHYNKLASNGSEAANTPKSADGFVNDSRLGPAWFRIQSGFDVNGEEILSLLPVYFDGAQIQKTFPAYSAPQAPKLSAKASDAFSALPDVVNVTVAATATKQVNLELSQEVEADIDGYLFDRSLSQKVPGASIAYHSSKGCKITFDGAALTSKTYELIIVAHLKTAKTPVLATVKVNVTIGT